MWTKSFASKVLREFAASRRRVVSDWRILIVARRLALAENSPLPNEKKAAEIRSELVKRGDVLAVAGIPGVYVVDSPYANLLEISEEVIIQEANPWAVFGYLTAMTYHGLTDQVGQGIYAIVSKSLDPAGRLPLGTRPDDWPEDTAPPVPRRPDRVGEVAVHWTQLAADPGFGVTVAYSFGSPIYATDVERTLLDSLRFPERCGGIGKVLMAWSKGESLDLDKVVKYTDSYDNQVMRQRVGFILDRLGKHHPRLDEWRSRLKRGGSLKLVASNAYSDTFSAEWNLSLNVPEATLAILDE